MDWLLLFEVLYLLVVLTVCARIIYDTNSSVKTIAYLLLTIFVPVFGMIVYFSFGINYRKRQLYSKKIIDNDELWKKIKERIYAYSVDTYYNTDKSLRPDKHLAHYLASEMSPLT